MKFFEPRLAVRIYLAGVAQFAVVAFGFVVLAWVNHARDERQEREARATVDRVVATLGSPQSLENELDRVAHELDATIVIYDDAGHVVASNRQGATPEPPGPPPHHAHPPPPPPPGSLLPDIFSSHENRHGPSPGGAPPGAPPLPGFMIPVQLPDGHEGRAFYTAKNRHPPANGYAILALVLASIGVVSFITARSLAKPLTSLSRAAERLGKGDLDTRVRLDRSDEIGHVARAFDEMADHIAKLLRAEKELIANVSHELRTPLARIRVALDIASEGDARTARQSLVEIASDLGELEQLISDVLAAARLDLATGTRSAQSGLPPLHRETINIAELVDRSVQRFRAGHPDRPLDVNLAADLPPIEGDPVLLRRALDNLLENAHKYTRRPGVGVEIDGIRQGDEVWLAVRDRGIGIAKDDLPRVFRPFFRADESRARATGGLGLGLALVKRIVEGHGGTVEIESSLGIGTSVRMRLPLSAVAKSKPPTA